MSDRILRRYVSLEEAPPAARIVSERRELV
jgi:hypothetical protein